MGRNLSGLALSLILFAVLAAGGAVYEAEGAEVEWKLDNPLPIAWRDEPVSRQVAFEKPGVRGIRVLDPAGKDVPVQLAAIEKFDDGTISSATVWFFVKELPEFSEKTYRMVTDAAAAKGRKPGVLVSRKEGKVLVDAGLIRFALPGNRAFEKPVPLAEVLAPLADMARADGSRVGGSYFAGAQLVSGVTTTVEEEGPLWSTFVVKYETPNPQKWARLRITAYAGRDYVTIEDEFSLKKDSNLVLWVQEDFGRDLRVNHPRQADRIACWRTDSSYFGYFRHSYFGWKFYSINGFEINPESLFAAGKTLVADMEQWRFKPAFKPDPKDRYWAEKFARGAFPQVGIEEGWFKPDHDDSKWDTLRVDQFWEKQGYPDLDGTGWYRNTVRIPETLRGARLFLYMGAVDEDPLVYVNGRKAGERVGVELWDKPAVFEITDYANFGEVNHIAVRVLDRLYAGGLWKGVRLYAAKEAGRQAELGGATLIKAPLFSGSRQWGLAWGDIKTNEPRKTGTNDPPKTNLLYDLCTRGEVSLDSVLKMKLVWEDQRQVTHPRIAATRDELPELRRRAREAQPFKHYTQRLEAAVEKGEASPDPVYHYVLSGDAKYAEPVKKGVLGSLNGLVGFVRWTGQGRGHTNGHVSNHGTGTGTAALLYDLVADAPVWSAEEKKRARAMLAFLAYRFSDPDMVNYTTRNYPSGHPLANHPRQYAPYRWFWAAGGATNSNMLARTHYGVSSVAGTLAGHPDGARWLEHCRRVLEYHLNCTYIQPDGASLECPMYSTHTFHMLLTECKILTDAGVHDYLADERVKAVLDHYRQILPPPDKRFRPAWENGRSTLPVLGDGGYGPSLGEAEYFSDNAGILGWATGLIRGDDEFRGRMMEAWHKTGRALVLSYGGWSVLNLAWVDPSVKPIQYDIASREIEGFGVVLRADVGTPREAYFLMRAGFINGHYNGGELGHFDFYAKESPLALTWGGRGSPEGSEKDLETGQQIRDNERMHNAISFPERPKAIWGQWRAGISTSVFTPWLDYVVAQIPKNKEFQFNIGQWHDFSETPEPRWWTRHVLFVKHPHYVVLHDEAWAPLGSQFNLHVWADELKLGDHTAVFDGKHKADLEVFFARPAGKLALEEDEFGIWLKKPNEFRQKILRARGSEDNHFTTVLWPRYKNEAPPQFTSLAGGAGAKIVHPGGADYVFIDHEDVRYLEADVTFEGRVGIARERKDYLELDLPIGGTIGHGEWTLCCDEGVVARITGEGITLHTRGHATWVNVRRRGGFRRKPRVRVDGEKARAELKGDTLRIHVTDGDHEISVKF